MGPPATYRTPPAAAPGAFSVRGDPFPGRRAGESWLCGRLRALRIAAGLTQTDVAGGRFSKEYISQIERGKTRPTEATVTWLADRLNVDPSFLSVGVTTEERTKAEALLTRGEALSEGHEYLEAIEAFRSARKSVAGTEAPTLEVRLLSGEAWALQQHGEVRDALVLLEHARELTELSGFSDVDRADVLFRIGVCRYKLSSLGAAIC